MKVSLNYWCCLLIKDSKLLLCLQIPTPKLLIFSDKLASQVFISELIFLLSSQSDRKQIRFTLKHCQNKILSFRWILSSIGEFLNIDLMIGSVVWVTFFPYGVVIVRGGPMFVAFVGNPCPRISIPMNIYTSICLIFNKIVPVTLQVKLHPHKLEKFLWFDFVSISRIKNCKHHCFVNMIS